MRYVIKFTFGCNNAIANSQIAINAFTSSYVKFTFSKGALLVNKNHAPAALNALWALCNWPLPAPSYIKGAWVFNITGNMPAL
jgi:hypothetical protein